MLLHYHYVPSSKDSAHQKGSKRRSPGRPIDWRTDVSLSGASCGSFFDNDGGAMAGGEAGYKTNFN